MYMNSYFTMFHSLEDLRTFAPFKRNTEKSVNVALSFFRRGNSERTKTIWPIGSKFSNRGEISTTVTLNVQTIRETFPNDANV